MNETLFSCCKNYSLWFINSNKKEKSIFHTLSFEHNRSTNTSYTSVFLSSSITNGVRIHRYSVNIKTRVRKIIAIDRTSRLSTSTLVKCKQQVTRSFFLPFREKTSNRFPNPFVTTAQNKNQRSCDSFNIKNDTQTLIKRQKLLSL